MTKNDILLFEMIVIMFSRRQKPRENKISRVNEILRGTWQLVIAGGQRLQACNMPEISLTS